MIPFLAVALGFGCSVLHVCGDDPQYKIEGEQVVKVFSTYVEMILRGVGRFRQLASVLHVCGDDPGLASFFSGLWKCSPRMWR